MLQLAFDIGGTFTDIVLYDPRNGQTSIWKVPTTQHEHAKAVVDELNVRIGKKELAPDSVSTVFHATTVATNIILERNGQPTALITTRGFRDIFLIGRQKRYDINNLHMRKPAPLIHRADVFEVTERLEPNGAVVTEFDEADARKVAAELRERGYRSVAIVFLHAYASDVHERRMAGILAEVAPGLEISLSSHISPKIREYERTSTTVANAYVKPVVGSYLTALEKSLRRYRHPCAALDHAVQWRAGVAELARDYPIRIVESGPAAGVFMCADVGRDEGIDHLLTFDMGGTTAKLGAIDNGKPAIMPTFEVDAVNYTRGSGLPLNITAIELLEIGAGGGSIASANMGLISVGPQSAGADPADLLSARRHQAHDHRRQSRARISQPGLLQRWRDEARRGGSRRRHQPRHRRSPGAEPRKRRLGTSCSPTPTWNGRCASCRSIAAAIRAATRWLRSVAPAPCTPAGWRAPLVSPASSSRTAPVSAPRLGFSTPSTNRISRSPISWNCPTITSVRSHGLFDDIEQRMKDQRRIAASRIS